VRLALARGDECALCRGALGPIDYEAPQYHPLAFEVDHIVPISRGGEKTLENSRASHRTCNRQRSNRLDADAIAAGAQAQPQAQAQSQAKAHAKASTCPPGP
jgi:5-methylcytosine-specific restriction endonuclease McrA